MQRYQLGPDRAFEFLTRVSRISDVTLEALAAQMIEDITHQHNSMTDDPTAANEGPTTVSEAPPAPQSAGQR